MTNLSVNLNKVALMRNARGGGRPSVRRAAEACIAAGAHGITLHPRPDGRHALVGDVYELKSWLPIELNVEGNPFAGPDMTGAYAFPGFIEILRRTRPAQATLVPDAADQLTSDHGWRLDDATMDRLRPIVNELQIQGSRVSLFTEPDPKVIERAHALGADRVELYTGPYADAFAEDRAADVLPAYIAAGEAASSLGMGLNAGHDLNMAHLSPFLKTLPNVLEVSIGQALIADALLMGLGSAVEAYLAIIDATTAVSG